MPDMKYRDSCKNRKYLCDIQIYLFFLQGKRTRNSWKKKKSLSLSSIKIIVEYGLEKISNEKTITISLKDFRW
jgi:hypothetical protein